MIIDLLGHVAYSLTTLGLFLIGKKKSIGWIFRIVGDLIWVGLGIQLVMSSIIIWEVVFISQALFFWSKWNGDNDIKA